MTKPTKEVHRRRFLSTTAAASSLVFTKSLYAQTTNANDALNVGIIGTGAQGQILLTTCAQIEGVNVISLCDIWENYNLSRASQMLQGFGQQHTTYTDYKDMIEKEKNLDAVLIATPDFCHAQQAMDCLNAGLHVYCEPMLSSSEEETRNIVRAAKDSSKLMQVGYQKRSNPYYRYCFDHIIHETRLLGTITAINGQWNQPVQTDRGWPRRAPLADDVLRQYGYDSMDQFRNWRWYKKYGSGPVAEFASHQIDVFNWYLGLLPKSLYANGETLYYDKETHEWPDTAMAICDYEGPEQSVKAFYQSINCNSNFGFFENFMGSEGTLYTSENVGRVKVYREPKSPDWEKWVRIGILGTPEKQEEMKKEEEAADGTVVKVQESVIPPTYGIPVESKDPLFRPHLQNFFNAIQGKEYLNCPAEIGLQPTIIALRFNQAAENGTQVNFQAEDFQV